MSQVQGQVSSGEDTETGQIDGLTDTEEGAENPCMCRGVNLSVRVCDECDRACTGVLVHYVKSSVHPLGDAQLILCQNNLQLPDACNVFSFFLDKCH